MSDFFDYRLFYQKKGRIRYISHLDINRCMQRVLQRSGLPIWYTQGFHPHPYVTFALPLSLGFESDCECMDFRLVEKLPTDEIEKSISDALPEGLILLKSDIPKHQASEIVSADYKVYISAESPSEMKEKLQCFFGQDSIEVEKKSKKGMRKVELKDEILSYGIEEAKDSVCLDISLPAGAHMINPSLILKAFCDSKNPDNFHYRVLRCAIYCEGKELFV